MKKQKKTIILSQPDIEILLNQIINPSKPNQKLIKAVDEYKKEK